MAGSAAQCLDYLRNISDDERIAIGQNGRKRVLEKHTAAHRAAQLEKYVRENSNAVPGLTPFILAGVGGSTVLSSSGSGYNQIKSGDNANGWTRSWV